MSKRHFNANEIADTINVSRFGVGWDQLAGHFRCSAEEPEWKREAAQQQTMDDAGDEKWGSAAFGNELTQGFAGRLIRAKVGSICRALKLTRHDGEDLEQQIRLELLIRAAKFDPERGTWEAYVHCVANARARTHYRRLRKLPKPMPFSDLAQDADSGIRDDERLRHRGTDACQADGDLRIDVAFVHEQLDLDAQIMTDLLRVFSVSEVSGQTNLPRSTVADRVRKLREPFRDMNPADMPDQ